MRYRGSALSAVAILLVGAGWCLAEGEVRFARTPALSPDGSLAAFSYLGDIWTVPVSGGTARLITMHQAHEYRPVFSHDGRHLAFASNRHGQYDVYLVSVEGGKPRRLTYHSSNDYPCDFSPDGKRVLFVSYRSIDYPPRPELYTVPVTGGRVQRVTFAGAKEGTFSPDGRHIAYVRGSGSSYRKGYRGSSNDEIWICRNDGTEHQRITTFEGQDANPCWSPDGKALYYVSDLLNGTANLIRQPMVRTAEGGWRPSGKPQPVTSFEEDGIRSARASRDGGRIIFARAGRLWTVATQQNVSAEEIQVRAFADDKTNPEEVKTYTNGATEFALSPNERYIAFVVHGEIFLIPRSGGTAKRLTRSPANDHGLAWSPDNRSLAFLSDRSGQEDVYLLTAVGSGHIATAAKFSLKRLTNSPAAEVGLMFAPDGKRLSFLSEGRLYTMNPDGSDVRCIVPERKVIDYEWSPDGKWICYALLDGSYASELYIVPSTGATPKDPPRNITRYATFNAYVTWSEKGNKIAFLSERGANPKRNPYVLSLQKPSVGGANTARIDWDRIHLRAKRLTTKPCSRVAINRDGTMIAFRTSEGGDDLWVATTDGKKVTRLTTGNVKPQQIEWSSSKLYSGVIYFRDGNGSLRMVTVNGKTGVLTIPFKATLTVHRSDVFREIFNQTWRTMNESFYDPKHHGADWRRVRQRYEPLVEHVVMREDLEALLRYMMGELNASHLGISGKSRSPDLPTAELGLLFDERYPGPGLKVTEILANGPADVAGIRLEPGDILIGIDGRLLDDKTNVAKLLNGKSGQMVRLTFRRSDGKKTQTWSFGLRATSRSRVTSLAYLRWVERNDRRVAELSGGRLGYIHIPSMNEAGLERFLRALYSDHFRKEGLVLDVRYNGGGYTHDKILKYLGRKPHTYFRQRHGGEGTVLRAADRVWTKPTILLINHRSYSDAEIFASAYRALKLGKLVGVPTGGKVIGTGSIRLIDGSTLRVPRTGVYDASGRNMDKRGVAPDILVENRPEDIATGRDRQLERAVEALLQEMSAAPAKKAG